MPKDTGNNDSPSHSRGGAGLYVSLAAGGLLLLGCCVCGGGGGVGYYVWAQFFPLVGTWEASEKMAGRDVKRELGFDFAGSGRITVTIPKGLAGGKDSVIRDPFTYSFTRGNPSILEMEKIRADGSIRKERVEVTFEADTMTLSHPELKGKPGGSLVYRRIR